MAKKNKNIKEIKSIKSKLVNGELIKNEDALYINNPDYFLTFSDLEISDGIDIIENIMVLSDNYISFNRENEGTLTDVELMEITEEYKEKNAIEGGYISQSFDKIDYIINSYDDITVITVISNDLQIQEVLLENAFKAFPYISLLVINRYDDRYYCLHLNIRYIDKMALTVVTMIFCSR